MTIKSFNLVVKSPKWGIRHLQVLFLFTCATLTVAQRFNMSVAIVAFTNANSSNPYYPEYKLTEQHKSYTISSPFWGSCCTQMMSGYLSSRFVAKMLLLAIMLLTALLSIATPFDLAWGGWQLLFCVRFVQGLAMGGMWPCLYTHLAKWCPKEEANRLGGVMTTGLDCGTIIGFALSGLLSASPLGWPSTFYVPGYLGIVWCLLFLRYGANSPPESRFISLAEPKHIELALEQNQGIRGEIPPVPWLQILTSRPFIVLAFCKMSQACSFYTLMQQIRRYIHGVFHYSIAVNALLSALPFVVMLMSSYGFIFLAEYLTRYRDIPLPILRKTINSFATWTPAVALVSLSNSCHFRTGHRKFPQPRGLVAKLRRTAFWDQQHLDVCGWGDITHHYWTDCYQ